MQGFEGLMNPEADRTLSHLLFYTYLPREVILLAARFRYCRLLSPASLWSLPRLLYETSSLSNTVHSPIHPRSVNSITFMSYLNITMLSQ